MRVSLLVLIAAVLSLFGCASASADEGGALPDTLTLTGSVVYRERMALPPDAVVTVTLEDISRADAPAITLGQTSFPANGRQVPIPFTLVYPGSAVQPGAVYAARARVTVGDQLWFTTTSNNPVDAQNPAPIELMMNRVQTDPPPVPDVSLTETYWKLIEVRGQPVQVAEGMREPSIVLHAQDSRMAGSGGVNRLMGGYTVDGGSLTFSQVASTMMAGPPEAMQQEQAIVAALGAVRGFGIAGNDLTLLDEAGAPVLKAVAVALR